MIFKVQKFYSTLLFFFFFLEKAFNKNIQIRNCPNKHEHESLYSPQTILISQEKRNDNGEHLKCKGP